jgi:hypothetical protein
MLPLLSPEQAYNADIRRNPGRSDFAPADTAWLVLTHVLHRLHRAEPKEWVPVAKTAARTLHEYLAATAGAHDGGAEIEETRAELARFCDALPDAYDPDAADRASQAVRMIAQRMAMANALHVAYTTVADLRGALPATSGREHALCLALQAAVARLFGTEEALDAAQELDEQVEEFAVIVGDAELRVRSLLGRGVIARIRGNYPVARKYFTEGLAEATAAGLSTLAATAHNSLAIAAGVAGDYDTALVHGWVAYELARGGGGTAETEALINLSEAALRAGYPEASLQALRSVLSRAEVPRLQLPAAAAAAHAAALLGDAQQVSRLAAYIDDLVAQPTLPYDAAQALFSLWLAYSILAAHEEAEAVRVRVYDLATRHGFTELAHKTEPRPRLVTGRTDSGVTRQKLQEASDLVIQSMGRLDADEHRLALAGIG